MPHEALLRRLEAVAADRDGVLAASEVAEAGVSADFADALIRDRAMALVTNGVYVLGSRALTDRQLLQTSLILGGPGSAISHLSALALHGLCEFDPREAWVTTPRVCADRTVRTLMPMESTGEPADIHIISNRW